MAETVTIAVKDLQGWLAKLQPDLYLPAIAELMNRARLRGETLAKKNAEEFSDTSALARSITSSYTPLSARVYVPMGQPTARYAPVMEFGRHAGAKMPPPDALVGWLQRHGIDPKLKFVIARAIGKRGIKGRFFMTHAAQTLATELPGLMTEAAAVVEDKWKATNP